jgi:uncharacterized membrane protein YagU involved in acid resistance
LAFTPGVIKTYIPEQKNNKCQSAEKHERIVIHPQENNRIAVHLCLLFFRLIVGFFANFVCVGEEISLIPRIMPPIHDTIAMASPIVNNVSCGICERMILPKTMPANTSLPKSSRNFPMSSLNVVRFLGFFIATSARILRGGAICFEKSDICHVFFSLL